MQVFDKIILYLLTEFLRRQNIEKFDEERRMNSSIRFTEKQKKLTTIMDRQWQDKNLKDRNFKFETKAIFKVLALKNLDVVVILLEN